MARTVTTGGGRQYTDDAPGDVGAQGVINQGQVPGQAPTRTKVNTEAYAPSPADRMKMATDALAAENLKKERWGRENEGMFNEALASQEQAAMGNTPSVANLTMRNQQNAALGAMQSSAGGSRGGSSLMLGQMGGTGAVAAQNAGIGLQGAASRSNEIQDARMGLFGGISDDRRADIAGNAAKNKALGGMWNNMGANEQFWTNSGMRGLNNEATQWDTDEDRRMGIIHGGQMRDAMNEAGEKNNLTNLFQQGFSVGGKVATDVASEYEKDKAKGQPASGGK